MDIFSEMEAHGHEQVVFCHDRDTGLKLIIGIHDTSLGPALGGCRMWGYSSEADAVTDVLRLSEGMTFKNASMGLDLGGGKCVIMKDGDIDREALFRAVGRFVSTLGGRYITAEDVGTSTDDMAHVARETAFVKGLKGRSGDPSTATAFGVFMGMKACLRQVFGNEDLKGRKVAIQGMGHVGRYLAERLSQEGASLVVTDIDADKAKAVAAATGASVVGPDAIYGAEADLFAPCALGAILNDDTIGRLRVRIVAGSANNQLKEPRHGAMLAERGILYAPDFIINGGGVINVADEMGPGGYDQERAMTRVATIYDLLRDVFRRAEEEGILPQEAAHRIALERIEKKRGPGSMFIPAAYQAR